MDSFVSFCNDLANGWLKRKSHVMRNFFFVAFQRSLTNVRVRVGVPLQKNTGMSFPISFGGRKEEDT